MSGYCPDCGNTACICAEVRKQEGGAMTTVRLGGGCRKGEKSNAALAAAVNGKGAGDMRLRDDDGQWVTAGDEIEFAYGIPLIYVRAKITQRGNRLIGICPPLHKPAEFNLRSLRRHVCNWYKA